MLFILSYPSDFMRGGTWTWGATLERPTHTNRSQFLNRTVFSECRSVDAVFFWKLCPCQPTLLDLGIKISFKKICAGCSDLCARCSMRVMQCAPTRFLCACGYQRLSYTIQNSCTGTLNCTSPAPIFDWHVKLANICRLCANSAIRKSAVHIFSFRSTLNDEKPCLSQSLVATGPTRFATSCISGHANRMRTVRGGPGTPETKHTPENTWILSHVMSPSAAHIHQNHRCTDEYQ